MLRSMLLAVASAVAMRGVAASDNAPHAIHTLRTSDGATLEYLDFGGPPDASMIVLLPGYNENGHIFDDFAPVLAMNYRVVALTPRGHGASSTPRDGYTVDRFADDVHDLLETLNAPRAVLVGHSLAGSTITRVAVEWPSRVQALVYLDATIDFHRRAEFFKSPLPTAPALTDSSPAGVRRYYADKIYGFWSSATANAFDAHNAGEGVARRPPLLQSLLADAAAHPKAYAATRAPILAIVVRKTIEFNYPWMRTGLRRDSALVNHAQELLDSEVNPYFDAGADRLLRERPDASVVRIQGSHYIFITDPGPCIRVIREFVGDHGI